MQPNFNVFHHILRDLSDSSALYSVARSTMEYKVLYSYVIWGDYIATQTAFKRMVTYGVRSTEYGVQ